MSSKRRQTAKKRPVKRAKGSGTKDPKPHVTPDSSGPADDAAQSIDMDEQLKRLEAGEQLEARPEYEPTKPKPIKIRQSFSPDYTKRVHNPLYYMNMGQLRRYAKGIGVIRVRGRGRYGLIQSIIARIRDKRINIFAAMSQEAKDIGSEAMAKMDEAQQNLDMEVARSGDLLRGEDIKNPGNRPMSHSMSDDEYDAEKARLQALSDAETDGAGEDPPVTGEPVVALDPVDPEENPQEAPAPPVAGSDPGGDPDGNPDGQPGSIDNPPDDR